MTYDVLIRGGTVVDGTGAPARDADVGISRGRIAAIGPEGSLSADATVTIEARDLIVAPGFIDIHTHLDAQVFWDPACTPAPFHGVTTVIGGNCGFSVAPMIDGGSDYLVKMLAAVEEIPLDALLAGASWDWHSMGEYLDA